jgi:hypothetical protein
VRPVEFNFEFKPDFADAQAETTKSFGQGTMIPEAVFSKHWREEQRGGVFTPG